MTMKAKIDGVISTITMPYWHSKFIYKTKILPKFRPHHKCIFYDWVNKIERCGWYITDKNGEMIPWVHFNGDRNLICLYPSMIKKID